jgi:hypothetical protein
MAAMANAPRLLCVYALAFGVLFAPGSSLAQTPDPDLPAIDPPGKGRVMTHDDITSTSNCIGFPITPLCAIETLIACFERTDSELCRIALGLDKRPFFGDREPELLPYHYTRYRVLSAERFGEHDLPPPHHMVFPEQARSLWYTEDRRRYRPGDVRIVVLEQTCWRNPARCDSVWTDDRYTYHLRRMGDNWAVMISTTPDQRYEKVEIKREKF